MAASSNLSPCYPVGGFQVLYDEAAENAASSSSEMGGVGREGYGAGGGGGGSYSLGVGGGEDARGYVEYLLKANIIFNHNGLLF